MRACCVALLWRCRPCPPRTRLDVVRSHQPEQAHLSAASSAIGIQVRARLSVRPSVRCLCWHPHPRLCPLGRYDPTLHLANANVRAKHRAAFPRLAPIPSHPSLRQAEMHAPQARHLTSVPLFSSHSPLLSASTSLTPVCLDTHGEFRAVHSPAPCPVTCPSPCTDALRVLDSRLSPGLGWWVTGVRQSLSCRCQPGPRVPTIHWGLGIGGYLRGFRFHEAVLVTHCVLTSPNLDVCLRRT